MNLTRYPLAELKLVYRMLHAQLTECPELLDSELLLDLQKHLQLQARREGVDPTDHAQLDRWLGNAAASCESRVSQRRVIPFPPQKGNW